MDKDILFGWLFIIGTVSLVFPLELPVSGLGTEYASINSIDFLILVLVFISAIDMTTNSNELKITLKGVTAAIAIASGWIIITLIVALLRSPTSIQVSTLWTLKWIEGVILFILAQSYLTPRTGRWVLRAFLFSGVILAAYVITISQLTEVYRVRVFFGNPNTLSAFLNLIIIMGVSRLLTTQDKSRLFAVGAILLAGIALLQTGSRSGVLGLIVGVSSILILARDRLPRYTSVYITFGSAASIFSIPHIVPGSLLERLTSWVSFQNGKFVLTDTAAARSFRFRLRLIDKAIELFTQQPIFGYGWRASPSRLGYLDVHFTTLLAEIGFIGLLIFGIFYMKILQSWIKVNNHNIIGAVGGAWFISVLVQSIGGNFLRAPQILFIIFLLLAAAKAITQEGDIQRKQQALN